EFRPAENSFITTRGLADYLAQLPPNFGKYLLSLGPNTQWMDMGCGEGDAVKDYRSFTAKDVRGACERAVYDMSSEAQQTLSRLTEKPKQLRASVTGVTIEMRHKMPSDPTERMRFFQNYLERLSDRQLGKADLITDFFGVASYGRVDQTF